MRDQKHLTDYGQAMEYCTTCMSRRPIQTDPSKVYHNNLIKSNIRIISLFKNIFPYLSNILITNEKSLFIDSTSDFSLEYIDRFAYRPVDYKG
jgi:hypothetical protein